MSGRITTMELSPEHSVEYFADCTLNIYSESCTEIRYALRKNQGAHIKKLSASQYLIVSTGEIKNYQDNLSCRKNNTHQSMKRLGDKIKANVTDCNSLFVTLTYYPNQDGSPMNDYRRVYPDFKNFMKKISKYSKRCYGEAPKYIMMIEPQKSGAWHIHGILLWEHRKAPNIHHRKIAKKWGLGCVEVEKVYRVDTLAAYFFVTESKNQVGKNQTHLPKRIIKGERVSMYPKGMKIWSSSRGLKMVEKKKITVEEGLELEKNSKNLSYQNGFQVVDSVTETCINAYVVKRFVKVRQFTNVIIKYPTLEHKIPCFLLRFYEFAMENFRRKTCVRFFVDAVKLMIGFVCW